MCHYFLLSAFSEDINFSLALIRPLFFDKSTELDTSLIFMWNKNSYSIKQLNKEVKYNVINVQLHYQLESWDSKLGMSVFNAHILKHRP